MQGNTISKYPVLNEHTKKTSWQIVITMNTSKSVQISRKNAEFNKLDY